MKVKAIILGVIGVIIVVGVWGWQEFRNNLESKMQSEPNTALAAYETRGGLCPPGITCGSKIMILNDGSVSQESAQEKVVKFPTEVFALKKLMTKERAENLKEIPFTGTCPTAHDGQEEIYRFVVENEEISINSCEYEIPPSNPLIMLMNKIVNQYNSAVISK